MREFSLITKLVLLAVMAYAVVTIVSLQPKINTLRAENEALSDEILALEQDNAALQEDIEALGSDDSVMKIARERLNYVLDGEIIYINSCE